MDAISEPLTLAGILELNGLNRNSYNTLVRREGLAFMKRDLIAETGHRKYRYAHSVALGVFLWSRNSLIPIPGTADAVDAEWLFIRAIAEGSLRDISIAGWLRFTLWTGEGWIPSIATDPGEQSALGGRPSFDALEAMLHIPIHRIAREQLGMPLPPGFK